MRIGKRILCFALVLLVLISVSAQFSVFAEGGDIGIKEVKTIKVGYMNHPNFIVKKNDGSYYGCGVEFLNEVCKYTDWNIEYVYASWTDQLEMLENGDLDIVPMAQYSAERAERFLYSHQPVGIIQCILVTLPEGQNDIGNNALDCDGRTIGIMRGSKNIDLLNQYAIRTGFSFTGVEYDFQYELEEALLNKEVDIIACEQMVEFKEFRILDRFASDPYYYIMSKGNVELMEELDYIMSRITAYDPYFSIRLHQKYFGNGLVSNRPYFTKSEMEYIESHKELDLALIPDNQPLAYLNNEGQTVGIIPKIMDMVSELCGISFRYRYVPKDTTPLDFLKANPTYFGTGMLASNPAFNSVDMLTSDTYYTTYAALVAHEGHGEKINYATGNYTIGVPKSFQSLHLFISEYYPNLQIVDFLSVEDGLKALENGDIDLFSYTINLITPYLANPLYCDISIVENRFLSCPLCTVSTNSEENKVFLGIFNKCISMVPESEIAQLEVEYLRQSLYHFNDRDVLLRYQSIITLIALAVVLTVSVLLLILFIRQRKFNRDITLHAEYDMMTGFYNRVTMKEKAIRIMEQYDGKPCALVVFDIDDLKRVNDSDGHNAGDKVIKSVASIVKSQFSGATVIGRVGGDDFAILLCGIESKSVLVSILTKLQRIIASTIIPGVASAISISIGVAMITLGECNVDEFYRRADVAMRKVKSNGKNGFAFYSEHKTMSYRTISRKNNGEYVETRTPDDEGRISDRNVPNVTAEVGVVYDSDYQMLIESFPNVALYVIERGTHKVLYFNKRFRERCPNVHLGMSCRNIMLGPCQNCIVDTMGEQTVAHCIFFSEYYGDNIEITATKIIWQGIPAVMISLWQRNALTSSSDKLTGISNQDTLDYVTGGLTRLGFIRMMERMQMGDVDLTDYAVLFINIQDFKAVNEMLGSDGGDNVLRAVFTRIEQSQLQPIIGSRKESDHFIFLVEKTLLDMTKLPELLNFHWQYGEKDLFILCRCGIFMIEDNKLEIFKMIDRAKLAKEHIVDEYVRPYAVYEPSMLDEYSERTEAFLLFDKGIKNSEFVVFYQPVVDVKTEKIIGAEALVRKKNEDGTIVSPGKFIPILERTGYISMLDRYVGHEVKLFQRKRSEANLPLVPISFNLSQKDFYDKDFMDNLVLGFESESFPKGSVLLEITESAYTLNEKKHDELLKRLRDAGAMVLLDDFGTGYSSFGMFENYNFDRVKLDMSFVRQLSVKENVRQVVESIISMCHKLGVKVVAEGVESEDELMILRGMDCDYVQGYYFSKPLDEQHFIEYIENHL